MDDGHEYQYPNIQADTDSTEPLGSDGYMIPNLANIEPSPLPERQNHPGVEMNGNNPTVPCPAVFNPIYNPNNPFLQYTEAQLQSGNLILGNQEVLPGYPGFPGNHLPPGLMVPGNPQHENPRNAVF